MQTTPTSATPQSRLTPTYDPPLDPLDLGDRATLRRYLDDPWCAAQLSPEFIAGVIANGLEACLDLLDHPPEPQIPILTGDVDTTYLDLAGGEAHVKLGASDGPHPFAITDRDDLMLIAEQCRDLFEAMEEPDEDEPSERPELDYEYLQSEVV